MTRHLVLPRAASALLLSASALALATPASAASVLFTSNPQLARETQSGERVTQQGGLTQVRLDNGGTASFVDGASFRVRPDGGIDLYAGSVTVAGGDGAPVVVNLAEQGEGRVEGRGSSASFTVEPGEAGRPRARGHALTGFVMVRIGAGQFARFAAGEMWRSRGGRPERTVAIGAQPVPDGEGAQVSAMAEGGPLAAAQNGVPVVLGDALAAAGASGDIVAAARRVQAAVSVPRLETFPRGDLALLVAAAARLEGLYGGRPFNGAQADIIRTYLQYLAGGGSGAQFLTAYAGLTIQYLDLLRAGALPSGFTGTSLDQINSFIAFRGRTGGLASLSAQNRVLVEAYLAFILGGGNADRFLSGYTGLTDAYFAFLRQGGDPLAFAGASQQTINAYLVFLRDAGLLGQLTAQNRALLEAYLASLANGGTGFAFAETYRVALDGWFAHLASGRSASSYAALDAATLRAYLETLQATGLFDRVLGAKAQFYAGYLAWLQGGGSLDGYPQLPANLFAGYASGLSAYYDYLAAGGVPSAYTALTQEQIRTWLAALEAAGAGGLFLGDLSAFWSAYFAYVQGGGNPDLYASLPVPPDFPALADALNAYAAYLAGGGLPGGYSALSLAELQAYIRALIAAGRLNELLGANATLLNAYFTHLAEGGTPDGFSGLPVYAGYAEALNAYYAFLAGGGLPANYTAVSLAQLQAWLQALIDAGVFARLFTGEAATFLQAYYVHVSGGGAPSQFAGLPANGGGGTTPPVLADNSTYRGGFVATTGVRMYGATGVNGGGSFGEVDVTVNPDGSYSGVERLAAGTAKFTDLGGDSRGVIGRLHDGTVTINGNPAQPYGLNNGVHYLLLAPISGDLPASGTVLYDIVSATRPVYDDGHTAPGTFAAKFAVGFGTSLRYAIDGTITMPDATYTVKAGNPASGTTVAPQVSSTTFFVVRPTLTGPGPACPSGSCQLNMYGGFGGSNPEERLGFAYASINSPSGQTLTGAVLFGKEGTIAPVPSAPAQGGSATLTGVAATISSDGGLSAYSSAEVAIGSDGAITRITPNPATTFLYGTPGVLREKGRAGDTVGWSRWDGASTPSVSNPNVHLLVGAPATALPTSGKVDYRLVGGTAPTNLYAADGAAGSLSGELAVLFGNVVRVGFDLSITAGAQGWRVATAGGAADPANGGLVPQLDRSFGAQINPTALNAASCLTNCTATVVGRLFGIGASHVGLGYQISDLSGSSTATVNGVAVFGTSGTALPSISFTPPM